ALCPLPPSVPEGRGKPQHSGRHPPPPVRARSQGGEEDSVAPAFRGRCLAGAVGERGMQALKVVLGLFVLVAIAALAVVVAFPDRFGDYLPFMRSGPGQGGPAFVLKVEPDAV